MVWHTLLQSTDVTLLALIPTPVDRVVVWGALALVVGLIAWREYTLPDVSPPAPDAKRRPDPPPESEPAPAKPLPGVAPADPFLAPTEPRPVASPAEG